VVKNLPFQALHLMELYNPLRQRPWNRQESQKPPAVGESRTGDSTPSGKSSTALRPSSEAVEGFQDAPP
jgi:hypothetical protein